MKAKLLQDAPHGKKSLEEAIAERDERINRILNEGLNAGRITQQEYNLHQALIAEDPIANHDKMLAILVKASGKEMPWE